MIDVKGSRARAALCVGVCLCGERSVKRALIEK
jgi:hypothetical protein